MSRPIDLVGVRFGKLLVTGEAPPTSGHRKWYAQCECGGSGIFAGSDLRTGNTQSCGCVRRELSGNKLRTHGQTGTAEHRLWLGMLQRCYDPNCKIYKHYGGRGIEVCERWRTSFAMFLEDMGRRPPEKSLDRIDNERGYEPRNCRWATKEEQANNTRGNRKFVFQGDTLSVAQIAERVGLPARIVYERLDRDDSLERALRPIRNGNYHRKTS